MTIKEDAWTNYLANKAESAAVRVLYDTGNIDPYAISLEDIANLRSALRRIIQNAGTGA